MTRISREEEKLIERLLREADDQVPPGDLADRIMVRVAEKEPLPFIVRWRRWFRQPLVFGMQPAAVAAFSVLLVVSFWGGLHYQKSVEPQTAVLQPQAGQSAESMFLIGQGLIAGGKYRQALKYLNQASQIDPARADFAYWQGIAYGMAGDIAQERKSYHKSLLFQPDFYQANLNLGHSYLEQRELDAALEQYQLVLKKNEGNLQALYNQALIYREKGNLAQEKASYYSYLQWSRTGKWARRAVFHLNRLGDFRYRVFTIGITDMVIDTANLLQPAGEDSELEIDRILTIAEGIDETLHLIVFNEGNLDKAKETVLQLRARFLKQKDAQQKLDVKISWFDVAEQLSADAGKKPVTLKNSILIFTQSALQQTEERKMI